MNWLNHVPNLKQLKLELGSPREGDASALNVDFWRHPARNLVFSYIGDGDQEEDIYEPLVELLLGVLLLQRKFEAASSFISLPSSIAKLGRAVGLGFVRRLATA